MDEQTFLNNISEEELNDFQRRVLLHELMKVKVREYFVGKFEELENKNLIPTDLVISPQEFKLLRKYVWDEVRPTYQRQQILAGAFGILWDANVWVTDSEKTKLGCYSENELASINPVISAVLPIDTTVPDFSEWDI